MRSAGGVQWTQRQLRPSNCGSLARRRRRHLRVRSNQECTSLPRSICLSACRSTLGWRGGRALFPRRWTRTSRSTQTGHRDPSKPSTCRLVAGLPSHARRVRDRRFRAARRAGLDGAIARSGGARGNQRLYLDAIRALTGGEPAHQHAVRQKLAADLAGARRDGIACRRPDRAAPHLAIDSRARSALPYCSASVPG